MNETWKLWGLGMSALNARQDCTRSVSKTFAQSNYILFFSKETEMLILLRRIVHFNV